MPSFSRGEVILVRYPFSDLSSAKVRPAVVVSPSFRSSDLLIVPLTGQISGLLPGEFELCGWRAAGLNIPTAVKRGIYTVHEGLAVKLVGKLSKEDLSELENSLRRWLGL